MAAPDPSKLGRIALDVYRTVVLPSVAKEHRYQALMVARAFEYSLQFSDGNAFHDEAQRQTASDLVKRIRSANLGKDPTLRAAIFEELNALSTDKDNDSEMVAAE